MTETEQALADAKREIEDAITAASKKLFERTGLLATVHIETINTDTCDGRARLYTSRLQFSYDDHLKIASESGGR